MRQWYTLVSWNLALFVLVTTTLRRSLSPCKRGPEKNSNARSRTKTPCEGLTLCMGEAETKSKFELPLPELGRLGTQLVKERKLASLPSHLFDYG